ncbi:substrate-binding domain-containing protein [Luteibacter sp.]|uniref:substrate-binding domain-containing protein n=1 Tax=Luteibacter sp. TaxID=1886636 RepID=UPI003F8223CD
MKFVAGAVLMSLASVAGAQSLVGGGATLPAIGYTGAATTTIGNPITPGAGSLFGVYAAATSGVSVSYCPTGSGAGKKILAGNDATHFQVNGQCLESNAALPQGFSAAPGGGSLAQAAFAASDAPMSLSEFNNYVTGHGAGTQPVQLPAIAGSIAVVFNKTGVNTMTLTEGQICAVFSGQITDWKDLVAGQSGPINIVYRSDGSGTSFSFLNHLSAVCPSNIVPAHNDSNGNPVAATLPATKFTTTQTFTGTTDSSGKALGAQAYFGAWTTKVGASGNAGVTTAVNATNGSIGYAEAANGVTAPAKFASVTNSHSGLAVNPSTGFGTTAVAVNLAYDQVIADNADANGRPVLNALSTTSKCIAVVNPNDYADPSTGYPILAVTYQLANAQANGSSAAAVRGLMFSPYNTTSRPSVTKIGRIATGYAWLSNADLTNTTGQTKVNGCVGI